MLRGIEVVKRTTIALISLPILAAIVYAQITPNPPIKFSMFDNAYELQQETGYNFGFPTIWGEINPEKNRIYGVDVSINVNRTQFLCADAFASVSTEYGVIDGARVFCPIAEFGEIDKATEMTEAFIDGMAANRSWYLHKNNMVDDLGRRHFGRSVESAFHFLVNDTRTSRGVIRGVPLMSWRSQEGQHSLFLNAVIHYRSGDNLLRYELSLDSFNSCFSDIFTYKYFSERDDLNSEEFQGSTVLRELFSDRVYSEIPDEERVFLTHRYVTEICENTASW